MKIVKFIIFLLFGLMFIQAGLDKFFHFMPTPNLTEEQKKIFAAIMEIGWLLPLVAVVEITGGLLVIFPKNPCTWCYHHPACNGGHPVTQSS